MKNGPALAGHGAEAVRDAITRTITTLPEQLRRSLTWDQGAEMAQHARLRIDTGVQVYFCDPHSPWQRGTNENTNGLLRQYFPRSTDLRNAIHIGESSTAGGEASHHAAGPRLGPMHRVLWCLDRLGPDRSWSRVAGRLPGQQAVGVPSGMFEFIAIFYRSTGGIPRSWIPGARPAP